MQELKETGDKMEFHRNEKKMSLTELAEKADMDEDYLTGIIKGQINLTALDLLRIAKALGVSMALLI